MCFVCVCCVSCAPGVLRVRVCSVCGADVCMARVCCVVYVRDACFVCCAWVVCATHTCATYCVCIDVSARALKRERTESLANEATGSWNLSYLNPDHNCNFGDFKAVPGSALSKACSRPPPSPATAARRQSPTERKPCWGCWGPVETSWEPSILPRSLLPLGRVLQVICPSFIKNL